MPNKPAFNVAFKTFQKAFVARDRVLKTIQKRGEAALAKIGAYQMRAARKSIKRRVITKASWAKLREAIASGDKARVQRLIDTQERRRTTRSAPGQPPIAHVDNHPVRSIRAIYFAVLKDHVTTGPVAANGRQLRGSSRVTVSELLEFGGSVTVEEVGFEITRYGTTRNGRGQFQRDAGRRETVWRKRRGRRALKKWETKRSRRSRVAARPFMFPMLVKTQPETRKIIAATLAG